MDLGLDFEVKKAIVTGISSGYTNFLTQKKVLDDELVINSAFAWMKSNYVDSALAKNAPEKLKYEIKKIGSWKYISFELLVDGASFRFVLKPPMAIDSLKKDDYYLSENSLVNKHFVESPEFKKLFSISEQGVLDESIMIPKQMTLFNGNIEDRFYIISYEVNNIQGIKSIEIYVPYEGVAYQVGSLTDLVSELGLSIPEDLLKSVKNYDMEDEELSGADSSQYETFKVIKSKNIDRD
ncbi:hypothetical protein [Enterococcus faecalis]|uniref:hypothetical protein n=1 Tax=Enterococcus faecalis TaxID=1351 RepID=UPI0031CD4C2D